MIRITKSRLSEILHAFPTLKIGIVGDFALDAYFYVDMTRAQLSRETPLFNHPVVRERYSPGGAANVAWNLSTLGAGKVFALTVLGQDWRCSVLKSQLADAGIQLDHIITTADWVTPFFGKVILMAQGREQEDARLDFINDQPLPANLEQALISQIEKLLPSLNAVVIADYLSNGVITSGLQQKLRQLAEQNPGKVFVADSRENIAGYLGMVLKPNELEAAQAVLPGKNPQDLSEADWIHMGRMLHTRSGQPVFLTLGKRGCLVFDKGQELHLPAVISTGPVDPVGAGDTFLAAISASLAACARPDEAAVVASLAAGVTVRKLQITGTASPEEILGLHTSSEYESNQ